MTEAAFWALWLLSAMVAR